MGLLTPTDWQSAKWIGRDETDDSGIEITDVKAANWLCHPESNGADHASAATRYFRRQITLPPDRQVVRAILFFAGDDVAMFYVNGTLSGIGGGHPVLIGADVTGQLKPGLNQLAVSLVNGDRPDIPANPGGWVGSLRVEFDKGEPLVIFS